jgi:polyhydroxyalkanoate synthesis regulator phasin
VAADDLFKRYLEVGAAALGVSRERAEGIVRDLVASGEVAKGQAAKAADWLVERGRAGTEELAETIRREVRQQVAAMGLATREDIARLEARLDALESMGARPAGPAPAEGATPDTAAAAPARGPRKAATARKAGPAGTAPPAPSGGPSGGRQEAGVTRSGSVRRRSGPGGAHPPAAAPPGGDAVPPGD